MASGNGAKQPDASDSLCLQELRLPFAVTYIYRAFLHIRLNESGLLEDEQNLNMNTHAQLEQPSIQTFQVHALKQGGFLFAVAHKKLTRSVSEQASESVINLFSLAPRGCGHRLMIGREKGARKEKKKRILIREQRPIILAFVSFLPHSRN